MGILLLSTEDGYTFVSKEVIISEELLSPVLSSTHRIISRRYFANNFFPDLYWAEYFPANDFDEILNVEVKTGINSSKNIPIEFRGTVVIDKDFEIPFENLLSLAKQQGLFFDGMRLFNGTILLRNLRGKINKLKNIKLIQ